MVLVKSSQEVAEEYVADMERQQFWQEQIDKGRFELVDNRLEAFGKNLTFALPVGKLAGVPKEAGVLMAEGGGVLINEARTITKEAFKGAEILSASSVEAKVAGSTMKVANQAVNLNGSIAKSGMTNTQAGQFFGWGAGRITKNVSEFNRSMLEHNGWTKEVLAEVAEVMQELQK